LLEGKCKKKKKVRKIKGGVNEKGQKIFFFFFFAFSTDGQQHAFG